MKQTVWVLSVLYSVVLCSAQTHPRLFFSASDVAALRSKRTTEPFQSISGRIQGSTSVTSSYYLYSYSRASNNAFMYILTGEGTWANNAKSVVNTLINSSKWANGSIKGLELYAMGRAAAIAYDLCFGAWDQAFQRTVSQKLKQHADVIYNNGGTEQNGAGASNWTAMRYSSAGLCYMATDEGVSTASFDGCWSRVVAYCRDNMGDNPLSRGWNIEGIGYTTYPWGVCLGGYGIAAQRRNGAHDLRTQMESVRWALWTVYAATCRIQSSPYFGLRPDFADDYAHVEPNGTYGLAFYYCHPELIPGIKFWYDRINGSLGAKHYDYIDGGAIYDYLLYPADIQARNPMTIQKWRDGFVDVGGNGFFTFRNKYEDHADMVAQINLKLRGASGHNGPDLLSFRIIGHGTPFAVGGGRYGGTAIAGHDPYWSSMNTLYPIHPDASGLTINKNSGLVVGTPRTDARGGGYVIGHANTNNVGVSQQHRWFVADHSTLSGADAVYVIADTSVNGAWWQLCTVESQAITIDAASKTFVVSGANGSSMKGSILHQTGALNLQKGRRNRGSAYGFNTTNYNNNNFVLFQSADRDYLVVLTVVGSGSTHPAPVLTGAWPRQAAIHVGALRIAINGTDVQYGAQTKIAEGAVPSVQTTTIGNAGLSRRIAGHQRYDIRGCVVNSTRNASGIAIQRSRLTGSACGTLTVSLNRTD